MRAKARERHGSGPIFQTAAADETVDEGLTECPYDAVPKLTRNAKRDGSVPARLSRRISRGDSLQLGFGVVSNARPRNRRSIDREARAKPRTQSKSNPIGASIAGTTRPGQRRSDRKASPGSSEGRRPRSAAAAAHVLGPAPSSRLPHSTRRASVPPALSRARRRGVPHPHPPRRGRRRRGWDRRSRAKRGGASLRRSGTGSFR